MGNLKNLARNVAKFVVSSVAAKRSALLGARWQDSQWVKSNYPYSKVCVANMGPTWVLSAPGGPHVGPMNLAIRVNFLLKLSIQKMCFKVISVNGTWHFLGQSEFKKSD